jgi:DNA polymerase-3 subunit epsilon
MVEVHFGPWSSNSEDSDDSIRNLDEIEFVVIDTETTGLFSRDRIIEIGVVAFKGKDILEEWSTLINPMRDVGPTQIHGVTASMVSIAPTFGDIANDLARLINGRVIICHNASFDIRMLKQEFERQKIDVQLGKAFCTMIASRRLLPAGASKLTDACEELEIPIVEAHSALGDARMTYELFQYIKEDSQNFLPALIPYNSKINPVPTVKRKIFDKSVDDSLGRIQAFTKKVPFPTSDESEIAYLLLLNMAMDDLVISPDEKTELTHWAIELGISEARIQELHNSYLDSFIQAALRDKLISEIEKDLISRVGRALDLVPVIPELRNPNVLRTTEISVGMKVCFTGTATNTLGNQIMRNDLEAMAAKIGLQPVGGVSKKGCDLVVAADVESMSGKAQKARDWGIQVISVEKFISYCTFG